LIYYNIKTKQISDSNAEHGLLDVGISPDGKIETAEVTKDWVAITTTPAFIMNIISSANGVSSLNPGQFIAKHHQFCLRHRITRSALINWIKTNYNLAFVYGVVCQPESVSIAIPWNFPVSLPVSGVIDKNVITKANIAEILLNRGEIRYGNLRTSLLIQKAEIDNAIVSLTKLGLAKIETKDGVAAADRMITATETLFGEELIT
jgi:hypothetical protein